MELGLQINLHKSNIYGIGVSNNACHYISSCIGCAPDKIPFCILVFRLVRGYIRWRLGISFLIGLVIEFLCGSRGCFSLVVDLG